MAHFQHSGFDFNDYRSPPQQAEPFHFDGYRDPAQRVEPFQWQRPSRSTLTDAKAPISLRTYAELDEELRNNEEREFRLNAMADSVHTAFQEEIESSPPTAAGVDEYDPPPSRTSGYMQARSPFALDASIINQRSFMEWYPEGKATLTFPGNDGDLEAIQAINLWMIEERSPLLAASFEDSRSGPMLFLETLTTMSAFPFLRYLYTGSYAVSSGDGDYFEDVPTSVLLHCQLYRLGDIYDLPELKSQAYVNVLRQCEFGCSSPDKPIDLCAAITYVYVHLADHENLIDAIINYCVSCFLAHRLAEDEGFKNLAYELRPFHQALCRNCMQRGFENETASAIIQLPYKPYIPETYASREGHGRRFEDVVYHFHSGDDAEFALGKRKRTEPAPKDALWNMARALRQREQPSRDHFVAEESASEDDEFTLVPKKRASSSAARSCEDEYEVVAGPAPVEEFSTDSDSDTLVEVAHPTRLPIRNRPAAASAANAGASDNDSDSDWTVV